MLAQLNHDDLVLTANRRLANDLRHRYDVLMHQQGHHAWRSPRFMPLNAWLMANHTRRPTLSDSVAHLLWHDIIQNSEYGGLLICSELAAQQAFDASVLCTQWQLSDAELTAYDHDGLHAFLNWKSQYRSRLQALRCDDQSAVIQCALDNPIQGEANAIHFVGFDHFHPIIKTIIQKHKAFSAIHIWQIEGEPAPVQARVFNDLNAELNSMVAWAVANQHRRIACIVPDIRAQHHLIAERFAEHGIAANIAAAIPLSNYPIVQAATLLLHVVYAEAEYAEQSSLTRSPFLQTIPEPCRQPEQSPRAWAHEFIATLQRAAWPGQRLLTSAEFQTKTRLLEVIQSFAQTEPVFTTLTQQQALTHLRYHIDQTAFQPKEDAGNIQVLGMLEAAGLAFDAIWLQGVTDETLPQALNPNPFLPIALQRQHHMPRANPEQELLYAQKLVTRLRCSCSEMHVSYAQFEGDRPLAISPLFADAPIVESAQDAHLPDFAATPIERLVDHQAPPVDHTEHIRGGSYILKAQASCPFKAFAEIRLQAEPAPEPTVGIDPSERGTWVHEILQSIWTELATHADLLAADLARLVDRHIEISARNLPTDALHQIEMLRLKQLIIKWLEYEKNRPPFAISALETEQSLTLGGLSVTMRLDRMDQLADGSFAIIDYKTGKASMQDWFTERPSEPQLPLYCLANDQVRHVSFAKVRLSDHGFSGISTQPNLLLDTKPVTKFATDWPDLRAQWREAITALAVAFCAGDARVEPKNGAATCQYCCCQPLCRIFEHEHH